MTRNKKILRLAAVSMAAAAAIPTIPAQAASLPVTSTKPFNGADYASMYSDVAAHPGFNKNEASLKLHYDTFGIKEFRAKNLDENYINVLRNMFDATYYAEHNKDVVDKCGTNPNALFAHFVLFGMKEGRNITPYFDVHKYLAVYPDLQTNIGEDYIKLYIHFATCGQSEHRSLAGFPADKIPASGATYTGSGSSSGSSSSSSSAGSKTKEKTENEKIATDIVSSDKINDIVEDLADDVSSKAETLMSDYEDLTGPEGSFALAMARAAEINELGDGATEDQKNAVKALTETALNEMKSLKSEADAALSDALNAKDLADQALSVASANLEAAQAENPDIVEVRNAYYEAQENVNGIMETIDEIQDTLDVLDAKKVDGDYYKLSDLDYDEETETYSLKEDIDNPTPVSKNECIDGLEEIRDAIAISDDDKTQYNNAKSAILEAEDGLGVALAAEKRAQMDAIDAYNETVEEEDRISYSHDLEDFNFDDIIEDNPALDDWLKTGAVNKAAALETAKQALSEAKSEAMSQYNAYAAAQGEPGEEVTDYDQLDNAEYFDAWAISEAGAEILADVTSAQNDYNDAVDEAVAAYNALDDKTYAEILEAEDYNAFISGDGAGKQTDINNKKTAVLDAFNARNDVAAYNDLSGEAFETWAEEDGAALIADVAQKQSAYDAAVSNIATNYTGKLEDYDAVIGDGDYDVWAGTEDEPTSRTPLVTAVTAAQTAAVASYNEANPAATITSYADLVALAETPTSEYTDWSTGDGATSLAAINDAQDAVLEAYNFDKAMSDDAWQESGSNSEYITDYNDALTDLGNAQNAVLEAYNVLDNVETYEDVITDSDYEAWAEVDEDGSVAALDNAIDAFVNDYNAQTDVDSDNPDYQQWVSDTYLDTAYDSAKNLDEAESAVAGAGASLGNSIGNFNHLLENPNIAEYNTADGRVDRAKDAKEDGTEALADAQSDLAIAEEELTDAEDALDAAETANPQGAAVIDAAEKAVDDAIANKEAVEQTIVDLAGDDTTRGLVNETQDRIDELNGNGYAPAENAQP